MGIVFAILWVGLAFIGGGPVDIILIGVGLIDAVFGIFLIFLPVVTYLGLFYVLVGALTIAVSRHGGEATTFVMVLTVIIFFITGGLTVVSYASPSAFEGIANYIANCEADMNIVNWDNKYWGLDTRCENWALFTAFCVYFLFLVQPLGLIALFFKKSGGGGGGGGGHPKGDHAGTHT